ncbi:hypothetical protein N665_0498s0026 [Sinapis alba]|nr:hypothetical protein N665_0498s0026 [Sinapis alba]
MIAASTKRLSRLHIIILTPRGVGRNLWRGPPRGDFPYKCNIEKKLTWNLRDLGVHIIALPSREQVTMLS